MVAVRDGVRAGIVVVATNLDRCQSNLKAAIQAASDLASRWLELADHGAPGRSPEPDRRFVERAAASGSSRPLAASQPLAPATEETMHARQNHRLVGTQRFLVLLTTLVLSSSAVSPRLVKPAGCAARPFRRCRSSSTEYPGQGAQVVEDQVLSADHGHAVGAGNRRVVRGSRFFGASFVYVIFEDGTDIYWARSRVLEYLNFRRRPHAHGVTLTGPDATGVGWVFQYAVLARTVAWSCAPCRTGICATSSTKGAGVAEVAPSAASSRPTRSPSTRSCAHTAFPGKWSQVIRDFQPRRGRVTSSKWPKPIHGARQGLPARRGRHRERWWSRPTRNAGADPRHRPVELAPDERRGLTELNGEGEVVSGIAMARYGQNALEVIHNLKTKIGEISSGLPAGVTHRTVYDRSDLIHRAIDT